jgi:hypothetical protein
MKYESINPVLNVLLWCCDFQNLAQINSFAPRFLVNLICFVRSRSREKINEIIKLCYVF